MRGVIQNAGTRNRENNQGEERVLGPLGPLGVVWVLPVLARGIGGYIRGCIGGGIGGVPTGMGAVIIIMPLATVPTWPFEPVGGIGAWSGVIVPLKSSWREVCVLGLRGRYLSA